MKTRHFFAILVGVGLILWSLESCNMTTPVSISQRIADFQGDLNTSSRTNVYNDFHPTMTTEYNALKDPNLSGFNTEFPTGTYSLSDTNDSNPAAVIVTVNSGPSTGSLLNAPYFLELNMATYNSTDWRIVTLSDSQTNGSYTQRFY